MFCLFISLPSVFGVFSSTIIEDWDILPLTYIKNLTDVLSALSQSSYTPPFDRHDWIVDRCGTHVRYVIDFYTGRQTEGPGKMAFYLDVRPAVDDWEGIKTRVKGWWS